MFCAAQPGSLTRNVADRQYFKQAFNAREFAVTGYRMDRASGKPVLTLSYPAIDRAGAVWAVVFAELDLGWISQVAMRAALPPGSVVGITDRAGLILARYPDPGDWVGKTTPESPVMLAIQQRRGEGMLEAAGLDGTKRLYAFTVLTAPTLEESQGLYVTVGIPRDSALADADRLLVRNLTWAGVVVVLMVLAAAAASDLIILRPLGSVVRAARRLSAGDLSARAAIRGTDEIGVMARAFNTMAERLQDRVKDEQEAKEQLAERVGELDLLNQMGELLQSCFTLGEAYAVVGRLAVRLFPTESGALFALDPDAGRLEPVAVWGALDAHAFAADECAALRDGRTHVVEDTAAGTPCRHLPAPPPSAYLCTPLVGQGKALGMLYVMSTSAPGEPTRDLGEAKQRLAEAVAAQLGLGLANVELREVLRIQSIHDPLTGLFNRRYMEETLEREIHRARRSGRPMSVLMLDVDSFKQQNDVFGHEGGDAVLRELGALLLSSLRKEDIPCRYGGEEFVLVLPDAALDGGHPAGRADPRGGQTAAASPSTARRSGRSRCRSAWPPCPSTGRPAAPCSRRPTPRCIRPSVTDAIECPWRLYTQGCKAYTRPGRRPRRGLRSPDPSATIRLCISTTSESPGPCRSPPFPELTRWGTFLANSRPVARRALQLGKGEDRMKQAVRMGILVPALVVVAAGCATKGWVREEMGRRDAEMGQKIARVDDRVGEESSAWTSASRRWRAAWPSRRRRRRAWASASAPSRRRSPRRASRSGAPASAPTRRWPRPTPWTAA